MKTKSKTRLSDGDPKSESPMVREISVVPGMGETISVRAAKAHLSGLLKRVAAGHEIVVTSGGEPKARIVPMDTKPKRKPLGSMRGHLKRMPAWTGGPTADEIVRADRDGRGW